MGPEWLWQGVVGNLVAAALIFVGGVVLAYLATKSSRWFAPIFFGLLGCALVGTVLYTFTAFINIANQQPQTTFENLETNIHTWINNFRLISRKADDPGSYFVFVIKVPTNVEVSVTRRNQLDRYLDSQTRLVVALEHQHILEKFSKEQATRVMNEVLLEIAQLDVEWKIEEPPLKSVLLGKLVPITSSLTEDVFIGHLHAMGNARILAEIKLSLALASNR